MRGVFDAIVGPFVVFFRTHGWLALLMLVAICLYRLPDFIMGPMANPLYHDIGLSKDYVGGVRADDRTRRIIRGNCRRRALSSFVSVRCAR